MHELALAYALSALSGLRVSYPVAALSIAAHARLFHLPATFAWLRSDMVLAIALVVAVVELFAHKISWLDGALHLVHKVLAPLVGGGAVMAVDASQAHTFQGLLFAALGAGNAFGMHTLRATARETGSAFILGAMNPMASLAEDGVVLSGLTAAFSTPQLTACIAMIVLFVCWMSTYRLVPRRGRRRARA